MAMIEPKWLRAGDAFWSFVQFVGPVRASPWDIQHKPAKQTKLKTHIHNEKIKMSCKSSRLGLTEVVLTELVFTEPALALTGLALALAESALTELMKFVWRQTIPLAKIKTPQARHHNQDTKDKTPK